MSRQPPRVLVVEDDRALSDAMMEALRGQGYVVRTAAGGRGVDGLIDQFRPDLAVLDVRLPDGPDGFQIARTIRSGSDVPIVFVTAAERLDERLAGFEAGGDDYIVKPFAMPEFLARVGAVLRRSGRQRSLSLRVGDLAADEFTSSVTRQGDPLDLTPTEFALLMAFMRQPGRVLSKSRLLALVWDFDSYDENLVEVYVSTLRRKLEQHGPRVIHTVRGAGYVLRA